MSIYHDHRTFLVFYFCFNSWHFYLDLDPSLWLLEMCWISWCFRLKPLSQFSHLKSFCPSWTVRTCLCKWCFVFRFLSHMPHENNCFLPWILSTCVLRLELEEKILLHSLHLRDFITRLIGVKILITKFRRIRAEGSLG